LSFHNIAPELAGIRQMGPSNVAFISLVLSPVERHRSSSGPACLSKDEV
jgi:hypothetical protein